MLLFVAVFFSVYVLKLFDLQIVNGQTYRDYADRTSVRTFDIEAARGEIVDRNGVPLAVNRLSRSIVFDRAYMPKGTENDTILQLVRLLNKQGEEWIDNLPITVTAEGTYQFKEDSDKEASQLKNQHRFQQYSTAAQVMAELIKKYECESYSPEEARMVVSVRNEMEKKEFSLSIPYTFAENISVDTVSIVMENSDTLPGATVQNSTVREYVSGDIAPHVIGTIGPIDADEYKSLKDAGYKITDDIGKFGVEASMEEYLRGTRGKRAVETSKTGAALSVTDLELPVAGNTVKLTLDSKLQKVVQDALKETVDGIREAGEQSKNKIGADCNGGAAIVMNPKTFEVLAMATYPSFDLSTYMEDYFTLASDETGKPLINRTLDSIYPPGSVMKVATAISGLESGAISPSTRFRCNHLFPLGGSTFQCLGWHGNITVPYALKDSCNIFFYETSLLVGIDKLNEYSRKLGLGVKTGIELPEVEGILAGRNDKETIKEGGEWYPGNTLQAAIGQSHNAFTPMEIAAYISTVANGGTRYQTHVVKSISDYNQTKEIVEDVANHPTILDQLNLSDSTMQSVREGMRLAMTSGSASYVFKNYSIEVAGKTGTSQTNSGSDHGLIACYAPYDDPEIVVVVVLEHGVHGYTGATTVKKIMDYYFYGETNNGDSEETPSDDAALTE